MRAYFLVSILFFCLFGYSQEASKNEGFENRRHPYVKLDISFPIRANQYAGEIDPYTGEKEYWFLPDGISARFGFGLKPAKWLGIAANLGIDWKGSQCLVVVPIFGTVKVCPKIGEDVLLFVEPGLGRALALGKNDLSGYFKKISFGFEDTDVGLGLFLELCQYGFKKINDKKIGSFSVELTYLF